ncbi:MAG: carbamoyltransferase HypF, partial [Anaerolineae bacterium]|nr:carbamoyltransferase HypF [Anaerolineae bacterium]
GELKNTFCLTKQSYAFLSHHIGDLENYETLQAFHHAADHYQRLFRVQPQAVVHDLHPDYMATRFAVARAAEENIPAFGVQHHHAHLAACLADNAQRPEQPVMGVIFDGTGYGTDGAIWGGEFLVGDYAGYERPFHLDYIPLPGGDKAVRQPWRLALTWLHRAGLPWEEHYPSVSFVTPSTRQMLKRQIEIGLNAPQTSSMGRLFDAVAALCGVRQTINYEAQAAIELEAVASPHEDGAYPFDVHGEIIDPLPLIQAAAADLRRGLSSRIISARFHNGVSQMTLEVCRKLRSQLGLHEVALSGGVWQNMLLLEKTIRLLEADGFLVYTHVQVPANDGGLALGQAAIAASLLRNGKH